MKSVFVKSVFLAVTILILPHDLCAATAGGDFSVVQLSPAPHVNNADLRTGIEITFDRPVDTSSITPQSFWAFGRWSGAAEGSFSYSNANQKVTLSPTRPFSAGEQVMVILSNDIQAQDGASFRSAGLSYQFFVGAEPQSALDLVQIAEMSTRTTPDVSTRSYGGFATDMNEDGWMDITVVNEDTGDLRTFLNRADNTGLFQDFLPPAAVNDRASPSEPTDFNHDGHADVCVVNINTDSVSVLLGNGDGTFAPQQEINVGDAPRGIAVLDVDGDGDTDIVNTNSGSGNLSLMLNNGNGVFGNPTFFEGGGSGEWALAAADMDNDNVLDLVVGARTSETIIVNKCNGDGTFTAGTPQSAGGNTWMVVCGDLNGDGNADVTSANSSDNDGSIILGNGSGGLSPPTTYPTDPFPLATDIADLDGDGDLDWIVSCFVGDWFVFKNNGNGTFTMDQEIDAPNAASCSLAVDIDNDRDLDVVMIDELDDVVIVLRNGGYSAKPKKLTLLNGTSAGGNLFDLETSNNQFLSYLAQPGATPNAPMVLLEVTSVLSTDQPTELSLQMEASANTPGTSQDIEMLNWISGEYELVGSVATSSDGDTTQTISLATGISKYVQTGTGAVKSRVGFHQTGIVLMFPWRVQVDKIQWSEQ